MTTPRAIHLSYSTNVHPAETLPELRQMLRQQVAPVCRAAFGEGRAAVNLRLNMQQADELLGQPVLPSTSALPDAVLQAPPTPALAELLAGLDELRLDVVSINAFPIRAFHAPRVKELVYSPPWTDGGRALYSVKIAKVLTHFMARAGIGRTQAAISVPCGNFKGLYPDSEEVRAQSAHFVTECVRELARLKRLTGRTVQLGLEPEPLTTGETTAEFLQYYETILQVAREKFPAQLGLNRAQTEDLVRTFVTLNLDLCHQAVEFEDPAESLRTVLAAGITVSGLHVSAALSLREPGRHPEALAQLQAFNEPRYLHQIVARQPDGGLLRLADLPDLWNPRRTGGLKPEDCAELRCHFHVPLCADPRGPLASTRPSVPPALREAVRSGRVDNFVVETYTWNVLSSQAGQGNAAAGELVGRGGCTAGVPPATCAVDVAAGLVKELEWTKGQLEQVPG